MDDKQHFAEEHIHPTLTRGLVALCRARPSNPVQWLGEWLVENKPVRVPRPVPHMPPIREVKISDESMKEWMNQRDIEDILESGAVALLDASWLVTIRAKDKRRIERRQDLPDEAFISLNELKASTRKRGFLPIVMMSYMWLHPEHPDPHCFTLERLARVLAMMLPACQKRGVERLGVFWDFCSLHQQPRKNEENELFGHGLAGLATLYGVQATWVLRMTKKPDDHPAAYDLPEDANKADYENRGWCFTEQSWSTLTKFSQMALDVGLLPDDCIDFWDMVKACSKTRLPPLLPLEFEKELEKKKPNGKDYVKNFTNGKDDRPRVIQLYTESYLKQFQRVDNLMYSDVDWGDAEMEQLVKVFAQTPTFLVRLYLHKNPKISARGLDQLASLLEKKKVVKSEEGEDGAYKNEEMIHPGITCDGSGVNPIKGKRYKRGEDDYDVCEAEFNRLDETEQAKYTLVAPPEYIKLDEKQWGVLPRLEQISLDNPEQCAASVVSRQCAKSGALNYHEGRAMGFGP